MVFPSFDEGMPNVILEAMSSGLPIVATDIKRK
ncbi:MAG: glycosyltransferase family 4 protein [Patescibacteria group bacterium]